MNKFTAATALGLACLIPVTLASPAFAVLDRTTITYDCVEGAGGENDHGKLLSEIVTITFTSCDGGTYGINEILDGEAYLADSTLITSTIVPIDTDPFTITVEDFAYIQVLDADVVIDDIRVNSGTPTSDPDGELLQAAEAVIGPNPASFNTDGMGLNSDGEAMLGGEDTCGIDVGEHVYGTFDITVTEEGYYTFRSVDTSPVEEDLYFNVEFPDGEDTIIGDHFMAIYKDFDASDVNSGVIGCNDDGDTFAIDEWNTAEAEADIRSADEYYFVDAFVATSTGYLLDDQFSWFGADLEPGQYTILLSTWDPFTSNEWTNGLNDDLIDSASVTFEMWGPEGGITLGHNLAATGVDPSFGLWAGLGLVGTGAAVAVARSRAARS